MNMDLITKQKTLTETKSSIEDTVSRTIMGFYKNNKHILFYMINMRRVMTKKNVKAYKQT